MQHALHRDAALLLLQYAEYYEFPMQSAALAADMPHSRNAPRGVLATPICTQTPSLKADAAT